MTLPIFKAPLEKMRLTQPYAVNYGPTADFYTKLGLKAHNGLDLSSPNGTHAIAVADGIVESEGSATSGYGLHCRLFVPVSDTYRLEVVYGHLQKVLKPGQVKAGDVIAETDNTGYSTGPHLHFGVRPQTRLIGGTWKIVDQDNGYFGYVDPMKYFPSDVFALPVDKGYGNTNPPSVISFAPAYIYFLQTQKRAPSFREYRGLRYGYWPLRDILDPAMFTIWAEMTYPAAKKKGIVK